MSPGGVRIGSPALTTRGMKQTEFRQIADFMARAAELGISLQQASGKLLKDFVIAMEVSIVAQQTVQNSFTTRRDDGFPRNALLIQFRAGTFLICVL